MDGEKTNDGRRVIRIGGTPNRKQAEFFASRAKYTAYGGARGGGKSWAVRHKAALMCFNYPGIRIGIFRRTYPELKANHIDPLISELGSNEST